MNTDTLCTHTPYTTNRTPSIDGVQGGPGRPSGHPVVRSSVRPIVRRGISTRSTDEDDGVARRDAYHRVHDWVRARDARCDARARCVTRASRRLSSIDARASTRAHHRPDLDLDLDRSYRGAYLPGEARMDGWMDRGAARRATSEARRGDGWCSNARLTMTSRARRIVVRRRTRGRMDDGWLRSIDRSIDRSLGMVGWMDRMDRSIATE